MAAGDGRVITATKISENVSVFPGRSKREHGIV
jgi:hypothetical protein